MFEHTSNSFLFLSVAFIALIVWLDSRTGQPHPSYAGRAGQPRTPDQAAPAPSFQAAPPAPAQLRQAQAPTVAATAQPQEQQPQQQPPQQQPARAPGAIQPQ